MARPTTRTRRGQTRNRSAAATAALTNPMALLILSGLGIGLCAWSWRKWPDVFVDFGHELYIPWRLAEGDVLYRDIAYFMGPLSQYINALAFTVFGTSFTTLIFVNLAILAGITWIIYTFFSRTLGRPCGLLTGAVFLCVFAFAQYVGLGNYNYVTPYLHEQTHGVALGLLLVTLLDLGARRPSKTITMYAGVTLGLVFLTKAEAFVPALASACVAAGLLYLWRRPRAARAAAAAALFAVSAAIPIAFAFVLLATQMPPATALRAVAGNWVYIFDDSLTVDDTFYADTLGLADIHERIGDIAVACGGLVAFVLLALALEKVLAARGRYAPAAGGVLVAIALAYVTDYEFWLHSARVLPLICAGSCIVFARSCWRRGREMSPTDYRLTLWSTFALFSLSKMILRPRLGHYGFALAMPGALLFVALMVHVAPSTLRRYGYGGQAWRAASYAATAVCVAWLLTLSHSYYEIKTLPVGEGGDRLYVFHPDYDPRGAYFLAALERLQQEDMTPDATLAVLPDGTLLNYLLRRPNPTPYYLITPWESRAFGGDDAVSARVMADAPDYFVLSKLDMSEYGPRFFGFDPAYGKRLRDWIEQRYESIAAVGHEPSLDRPWLRVYRRKGAEPHVDVAQSTYRAGESSPR
jgi:hypothetical protein